MANILSISFWTDSMVVFGILLVAVLTVRAQRGDKSKKERRGRRFKDELVNVLKITAVLFAACVMAGFAMYLLKASGVLESRHNSGYYVVPVLEFKISEATVDYWLKFFFTWFILIVSGVFVFIAPAFVRNMRKLRISRKGKKSERALSMLKKGCPPLDLLDVKKEKRFVQQGSDMKDELLRALWEYGIDFVSLKNIECGPAVSKFLFTLEAGHRLSEVTKYQRELAMFLNVDSINIIPSRDGMVIEIPNRIRQNVYLRDVLPLREGIDNPLNIPLGLTVSGELLTVRLDKAPHLLIAGATGSGKSVCINAILSSILFTSKPNEVRLILIDPKTVELSIYNGIPHLLMPVVTDPKHAAGALDWVVQEMERRYKVFAKHGTRDIDAYRLKGYNLPKIVIVIDEMADLMLMVGKDIEDSILRLGQKARAAGIHLIAATQRPSVDVVTGTIKANLPARIAFATTTQTDSRVILDEVGAEKLLGEGDGLLMTTQTRSPVRFQGAYISDGEIERVVEWWKRKADKYETKTINMLDDSLLTDDMDNCADAIEYDKTVEESMGLPLLQILQEKQGEKEDKYYIAVRRLVAELAASDEKDIFLPSLREIAGRLNINVRYVQEAIKRLIEEGWLKKEGDSARNSRHRIILPQEEAYNVLEKYEK